MSGQNPLLCVIPSLSFPSFATYLCIVIANKGINTLPFFIRKYSILLSASKIQYRSDSMRQSQLLRHVFYVAHWVSESMGVDCVAATGSLLECKPRTRTLGLGERSSYKGFLQQYQGVQSETSGRANIPYPRFPSPSL